MLREVSVYETADGKRHDNPGKAKDHIADQCRELLDARLADLMARGKLSANDRYLIVLALIPDANAAKALAAELTRWTEFD